MRSRLRDEAPALAVLGLIVVAGALLRVLNNDHGLPYVYYVDEGSHFTKRAVELYGDPNPGYFQNPSAFTYLLHAVYRIISVFAGGGRAVVRGYTTNQEWVYEVSRGFAAALCLVGVVAVFAAGRGLWDRRSGLVAAAVLCFAFLPVAFSRIAVTDVGTLAPVALCILAAERIRVAGSPRWCAAAGVAAGLAIAFKYTAGLVLLAPALALGLWLAGHRGRAGVRRALVGTALLGACTAGAFLVLNPYFLLDLDTALHQLRGQAELAGSQDKFGQERDTGPLYYLWSLGWGLGYGAAAAAAAGAVLVARRDPARLALLLVLPLAMYLYLSTQSRFFGRWLLPVYPVLALLAGHAVASGAAWLAARRPRVERPALAVACAVLLWQPLAADARSLAVLGHTDTRAMTREWLAATYPPGLRAIVEPAVPKRWYFAVRGGRPRSDDPPRFINEILRDSQEEHVEYGRTLAPGLLDVYRARGYCTVVTFDLVRGRAATAEDRRALAYYARLDRESDVVYAVSPYRAGARPPRFSFDLSYSYYSPAYVRPGPAVAVHQVRDCRQRYGAAGPT